MCLLSIIIPAYNSGAYLYKCVDSLKNAPEKLLERVEIILVDDGSNDNTLEIMNEVSATMNNVVIISQINAGVASARNAGLKRASGNYVFFLDSDDLIILDNVLSLLQSIDYPIDVIIANAIVLSDEKSFGNHVQYKGILVENIITGEQYLQKALKNGFYHAPPWLYVFRRGFLLGKNLQFHNGYYYEDEEFTIRALFLAKRVIVYNQPICGHVLRENSLSRPKDYTLPSLYLIQICYDLAYFFAKNSKNKHLNEYVNDYLVMLYLNAFYIGRLYRGKYTRKIDKSFLLSKPKTFTNKLKVFLFFINKRLYWLANHCLKNVRRVVT